MMQTWFESKVQYIKTDESGKERKVAENYLLDAVSFTDAETRMVSQMQSLVRGDFAISDIRKSKISEVFTYESGEWWFKASINLVTIDEQAGKEKKVRANYLIMADDIQEAVKRLDESLGYLVVPYIITSVAVSNIVDVFPYNPAETFIPANLKPLQQEEE